MSNRTELDPTGRNASSGEHHDAQRKPSLPAPRILPKLTASPEPRPDCRVRRNSTEISHGAQRKRRVHEPNTGQLLPFRPSPRPTFIAPAATREPPLQHGEGTFIDAVNRQIALGSYPETSLMQGPNCIDSHTEHCPLCGNEVQSDQHGHSMEYFYMLENLWRAFCQSSRYSSGQEPTYSTSTETTEEVTKRMISTMSSEETSTRPDGNVIVLPYTEPDELFSGTAMSDDEATDWASHGTICAEIMVPDYYQRFFREVRHLGSGSYGIVHLCQHHIENINLGLFAVKKIPIGDSKLFLEESLREVKVRESISHPNLLDYKHSWIEPFTNAAGNRMPWLFILCEFANCGDLESLIDKVPLFPLGERRMAHHDTFMKTVTLTGVHEQVTIAEICVWVIIRDILKGLRHLHRNLIMHRDLKLANVMLNVERTPYQPGVYRDGTLVPSDTSCTAIVVGKGVGHEYKLRVLIADFGTAMETCPTIKSTTHSHRSTGHTGTLEYASPELLQFSMGQPHLRGKNAPYTSSSEMWSVGIMVYALILGTVPWRIIDDPKQESLEIMNTIGHCIKNGANGVPLPDDRLKKLGISNLLLSLMSKLLRFNPKERPSANSVLESSSLQPFFSVEATRICHENLGSVMWNTMQL